MRFPANLSSGGGARCRTSRSSGSSTSDASTSLETKTAGQELILYDSRDLVTHAVAVGMTGSGKTGLCLSLVEEAVIDGVPVVAIDPKGDLTNLLLTFPGLTPEGVRAVGERRGGANPRSVGA